MTEFGVNVHMPTTNLAVLDKMTEAGFGRIRVDFNWHQMEVSHGNIGWVPSDIVMARAKDIGFKVFPTISGCPKWASVTGKTNGMPRNIQWWQDFVSACRSRYPQVETWGVWNEPNLSGFTGTKEDYIRLVKAAGVNSAAPELSGMGGPFESRFWAYWMEPVAKGVLFSVTTHHIYKKPTWWYMWRMLEGPTLRWLEGPSVKAALMEWKLISRPFWITEVGWSADDYGEKKQASYYRDFIEGIRERRWVDAVFFYEAWDGPHSKDGKGLLRSDMSERPAYGVCKELLGAT